VGVHCLNCHGGITRKGKLQEWGEERGTPQRFRGKNEYGTQGPGGSVFWVSRKKRRETWGTSKKVGGGGGGGGALIHTYQNGWMGFEKKASVRKVGDRGGGVEKDWTRWTLKQCGKGTLRRKAKTKVAFSFGARVNGDEVKENVRRGKVRKCSAKSVIIFERAKEGQSKGA